MRDLKLAGFPGSGAPHCMRQEGGSALKFKNKPAILCLGPVCTAGWKSTCRVRGRVHHAAVIREALHVA